MTDPSPRQAQKTSRLSELEAVVLGLVWAQGPCTAYAVRLTVRQSLSTQWSGSAGAVYPAVARLEERGLIRSRAQATGKRQSLALEPTAKGRRALAAWLGPPIDPSIFGVPADPLRVRIRFLELLPEEERSAFLAEAIRAIEADMERVAVDVRARTREGDPYRVAMARGALHATRARLRTLRELRDSLDSGR